MEALETIVNELDITEWSKVKRLNELLDKCTPAQQKYLADKICQFNAEAEENHYSELCNILQTALDFLEAARRIAAMSKEKLIKYANLPPIQEEEEKDAIADEQSQLRPS